MANTKIPAENISKPKNGIPTDGNRNNTSSSATSTKLNKLPFPKLLILIPAVCLLFFGVYFGYSKYRASGESAETPAPSTGMANPASVYCKNMGGTLEIREGPGGQSGYCVFDDGSQCEEWAFLNKVCQKGLSKNLSPTPGVPSDWKSYSSGTFEVKYPPEAKFNDTEGYAVSLSGWGPTQTEGTELFDGYAVNLQINQIPNTTLEDFINQTINDIKNQGISNVTSGPDPVILNSYQGFTYTEEGLGTFKNIVLQNPQNSNEAVVISIIVADPASQGFQETVNQILSTFKFN